jgi:hypothetical protein
MKKSYEGVNKYFILFSNIIPVKGAVRSLLCDLQLANYNYIPNDLQSILSNEMKSMKLVDLFNLYGDENKDVLNEYLDFLLSHEFGVLEDSIEQFPDLSLEWDYPGQISNAIIDLTSDSFKAFDYSRIFRDLSEMNCE